MARAAKPFAEGLDWNVQSWFTHINCVWLALNHQLKAHANKKAHVTNTASFSWVPVHDEEWDGDFPIFSEQDTSPETDNGTVEFRANKLPWRVGYYEVRTAFNQLLPTQRFF